jgi:hypothetical protein
MSTWFDAAMVKTMVNNNHCRRASMGFAASDVALDRGL